jgi:uncharacterized membrane protein
MFQSSKAKRVRKVLAWRVLSFTVAGATAQAFLGNDLAVASWTLTALLNVQMTIVHYFFEWGWDGFGEKASDADDTR